MRHSLMLFAIVLLAGCAVRTTSDGCPEIISPDAYVWDGKSSPQGWASFTGLPVYQPPQMGCHLKNRARLRFEAFAPSRLQVPLQEFAQEIATQNGLPLGEVLILRVASGTTLKTPPVQPIFFSIHYDKKVGQTVVLYTTIDNWNSTPPMDQPWVKVAK